MAILKKEYEISVWEEYLDEKGIKREKRSATIGSDTMSYLGKATNVNLKREINGTNTLTFKMPSKFFDSENGKYVKNEFIDLIYNEQKIKLCYDGEWFEFYVKQISEEKQFKSLMKTITCNDSFIDELSRTGYEVMFDEELYNNVDELGNFMNIILDDSIWDYRPDLNCGDFTEFKKERFYKIPLSQFGGTIKAYPIDLKVEEKFFNEKSDYYHKVLEENGEFIPSKEIEVKNIFFNETRQLELGDDLSREKEIFWDNYYKDNGSKLLDDEKMIELNGDYIYVPYSCLSFIYGNVFTNSYKSTEEPAIYGEYEDGNKYGYALQPASKNPIDLIQFMFFNKDDKILVDEEGTVVNNDCHYVIKISQWNEILKNQLKNKDTLIYWSADEIPAQSQITTKYEIKYDGKIIYSVGVKPNTKTIDDFEWYPVYSEGYMEQLGDLDVYAAKKISITDRTEFNLESGYYCTVYNNTDSEYIGIFSEKEIDDLIKNEEEEFRVLSHEETRIILPTLARNLIQNGQQITDETGWEALTQNDNSEYNTGSYANLLEIAVKTTSNNTDITGVSLDDEIIGDYYLELLSPNIMKAYDMDLEGTVSTDYALNFGLSSADIQIEKDKIYAIRICTGKWVIKDYNIVLRNNLIEYEGFYKNEQDTNEYKDTLREYCNFLITVDLSKFTTESTESDIKQFLNEEIIKHDNNIENILKKWDSCFTETDYNYLIYRIYENIEEYKDSLSLYSKLETTEYKNWIENCIIPNEEFIKEFNIDLDKIVIGEGSIDINGNYTLSGVTNRKDTDKFISFKDIFEKIENLNFIPKEEKFSSDFNPLTATIYYEKENEKWIWKQEKESEISIQDNAYLLFKAKANIVSPYVGIKVDSSPMEVSIETTKINNYGETDYSGVKIEVYSQKEDGNNYLVDGANIKIYKVDNNNFSDNFLTNVGWKLEENNSSGDSLDFVTNGSVVAEGIDVSVWQGDIDWDKVKASGKVEFAILRAGIGQGENSIDNKFERNYSECKRLGIPVGAYWYSEATNSEMAEKEAESCLNALSGKQFEYPIFYDIEKASNINKFDIIAPPFCNMLKQKNYYVGIYSYYSAFVDSCPKSIKDAYPVWIAKFGTNKILTDYDEHYELFQYSSTGQIDGILGNVDLDISYKNYPSLIKEKGYNGYNTKSILSTNEDSNENVSDRNNQNNNYTLNDDGLLSNAKPAWSGTSSSEEPLFFNALLPKSGDTCSMAYALFINDFYYGIFWLEKSTEQKEGTINE